jgi:hypothetical protein
MDYLNDSFLVIEDFISVALNSTVIFLLIDCCFVNQSIRYCFEILF